MEASPPPPPSPPPGPGYPPPGYPYYPPPPPKSSLMWLWLLLGIGGGVVVLGILAAIAIPSFMTYQKKAKRSEAELRLQRLYKDVRVYYATIQALPAPAAPPTPAVGSCCAGPNHKCEPDPSLWQQEPWLSLDFSVDEPSDFSYSYEPAPDGRSFVVRAHGDLDCDGTPVVYELRGAVEHGDVGPPVLVRPTNQD